MSDSGIPIAITIMARPYLCRPVWGLYANGRLALKLLDFTNGEPLAKATVNLPEHPMDADEVALSHEGDPGGMEGELVALGLIHAHHRSITEPRPWGKMRWHVCRVADRRVMDLLGIKS